MKTISLLITLVFLFSFGTGPIGILSGSYGVKVLAQETDKVLPKAGLTPDSPFYFLEIIAEGIGTFFTFGDIKKAERYALLAAERVAEAKAVIEKGKSKLAEKTLKRYEKQLGKALSRTEKAKTKGKNIGEVAKALTRATHKHLIVLKEVLEKVPEEAKPAIEQAMIVSSKGNERALEALPEALKDAFGFELLKAECIKAGAPPELCASLEAKCKELGVTTSEECERVLSTVKLEAPPKRILSE